MGNGLTKAELIEQIHKLEKVLRYVIEVREIECLHDHPPPDDSCAKCMADKLLGVKHGN